MNKFFLIVLGTLCVLVLLYLFFMGAPVSIDTEGKIPPADPMYLDESAPREARVDDLLSYMSLKEKIGQMALIEKGSLIALDDLATYGMGGLLSGMGGKPEENTPSGWKAMVEGYTNASRESRLGIPILYGVDAIHGHSNVPQATIFPHAIGLGATNDETLVREVAKATALEMAATGIYWNFAPNLDLPMDIRWGRTFEAFSEDAARAQKLGSAYVDGLQKEGSFVLATPKHYIGAGSMIFNSSSNPDYLLDQGTTPFDEGLIRETYLPPFKAAIDAGAQSVLVGLNAWGEEDADALAYNRFEDVVPASLRKMLIKQSAAADTKMAAHKELITDVLKGELGFTGFAVSDWYGVYEIPGGNYQAAVTAINAGIDMVMLPFEYKSFITDVTNAVTNGDISMERIDDAVRRILRAKFAAGLFDDKAEVSLAVVGSQTHRDLAREAVAASLVLLKNEDQVLPLSPSLAHIRVAGSAADNVGMQAGGWTVEWQGIDGNTLPGGTSIFEGIEAQAGAGAIVEYNKEGVFDPSVKAAVGIAVVGEKPYAEGWGDRALPILSDEDREAIQNLQASCEKVIVVLVSGRPLLVTNEVDAWDALVMAWLPGSEGAGVADVLFGKTPFSGTLPLSYPAYAEQLPLSADGKTRDGTPLLYPRGFGLR